MRKVEVFSRGWVAVLLAVALTAGLMGSTAWGQETTGAITGVVTAKEDGSVLPGATVEAVHVPTGTVFRATTQANGRFAMLNVRVGGPYTVTAALQGFKSEKQDEVQVLLGEAHEADFALELEAVFETLEVTAEAEPLITPDKMGAGSSVALEQIQVLPTIRRQIQDYARLNPYVGIDPADPNGTRIAVAGKNNRYNSIQIDGAVNNDLFGLADTGTPGGQADTQPISLDSIQELQVVVSPYDIKQGGFTGGGINAITRSGTNELHGSVYGSLRDQDYVSERVAGFSQNTPISDFSEDQYGGRIGGRILRDKLFFFASGEINRREQPTGVSADGSTATQFFKPVDAQKFKNYLISAYDYDPGTLGDFPGTKDSDLAFLRFDFNINPSNQMTLRHNYVEASNDVIADRSSTRFRFDTAIYAIADETNSTVLQLNSVLGSSAFNVARIGYQTIDDARTVPVIFPTVDIGPIARSPEMSAGTERFSGANSLAQDILEVTDDFTFIKGDHTVTIGTHNEFFDFENLFLSDFYGWYRWNNVDDFIANKPAAEYSITYATGDNPRRPTAFSVEQYGIYAGDQWRVTDKLTLTLGVRADFPSFPDSPSFNQKVYDTYGIDSSEMPDDLLQISPRLGFNWDLSGDARQQLRGGVGIFAGRTPYVWISNAYANTGVELISLSSRNVPFVSDPHNQPKNFPPGTGAVSVDLIDKNFEFPRVLRATLGYDRELPWGIRGTFEALYTQTQQDIYYVNYNKVWTGAYAFDGRPTYKNKNSAFANLPMLTNTDQGEQKEIVVTLDKRYDFGLYWNFSYSFMDAESAFDGTSSRAISNWQFATTRGDIYHPETSTTFWEVEDRFNLIISQTFKTGPVRHNVGLFYNVSSGAPWSVLIGGDPNTDGFSTNDLIYVPNSANDIVLRGASPEQFEAFLNWTGLDKYRGEIAKRNSLFAPWNRALDFHYDFEIPITVVRAQVLFDILNLLNLIDKDKGALRYVSNATYTPLNYRGIDAATGKPIYETAFSGALNPGRAYSTNDLRSRWQLKLGLRISF